MAHAFKGPKDKTNPIAYVPIAAAGIALVAWTFASGFMSGAFTGQTTPVTTQVAQARTPARTFNVRALAQDDSRELMLMGKGVYDANCASCHGAEGYGDGSNGAGLNPPPRNFHEAAGWKNGTSILAMWNTLENGIQGGSMASYKNILDPEQRMAVSHYIRAQWVPDPPALTDDEIAALPAPGASTGGGEMVGHPDPGIARVSYEFAMERLAEPAEDPAPAVDLPAEIAALPGAKLFGANCASCHGAAGQGREAVDVLTVFPYVRVATPPLAGSGNEWAQDREAFRSVLVDDRYAVYGHGFGTLTRKQVDELHDFASALARR
jgi:mono/diheme cytochrome c family protein